MKVKIYVEGGGDSKFLHARCREGFRKLLEKAGFTTRMPAIVACGSRNNAFEDFKTAVATNSPDTLPLLLVDSEEPVDDTACSPDANGPWQHLMKYDRWERPAGTSADQAQLMATCMESWIMADRKALFEYYRLTINMKALFPPERLETRRRAEVQERLAQATRASGPEKRYRKGERSFILLALLHPETLRRHLPHFARLLDTLERRL